MDITELIKKSLRYNKDTDVELIKKAYNFAEGIHQGHKRLSGEDYISHPFNVALILTSIKADSVTLAAALLHDVVEDKNIALRTLEKEFGSTAALLVDGVTKISRLKFPETADDETFKKLILAATKDVRVLFIKLADRLHNMRTLEYHSLEKQKQFGKEALELYGPLAYRLGLTQIKSELEDLGLKYYLPEEYNLIVNALEDKKVDREKRTRRTLSLIETKLKEENIKAEVTGRVKHIYSIYRKIKNRAYDIDKMYDLVALRVITENIEDCYKALRIIQSLWRTIPETFKDYISLQKPNGYQSIHLAVIVDDGRPVEFQIRTKEMHEYNEQGTASHWAYKGNSFGGAKFDKKIGWLKEIMGIQKESANQFVENIKVDLFSDTMFVFTPKNDVIELPVSSTVLDFAYSVHSGIGDNCTGAYVNGKFVGIKSELKNGDIIEIITSKNQRPSLEWLKFVRTVKARNYIRRSIKLQGKTPSSISNVVKDQEVQSLSNSFIQVFGINNPLIKFSLCCKPLPGEEIVGFLTSYKTVSVHKKDCSSLNKQLHKKTVNVNWQDQFDSSIEIKIRCHDRIGIFAEILNCIAGLNISVQSAKGKILSHDLGLCTFVIKVESLQKLCDLFDRLQRIKDVTKVYIGNLKN